MRPWPFFGERNTGLTGRGQTVEAQGQKGPDSSICADAIRNLASGAHIQFDAGIPGNVARIRALMCAGIGDMLRGLR